jgi:hypothetical protein
MATTHQVIARRIGRITFGAVLLAGTLYLVAASVADGDPPLHLGIHGIVLSIWLLAALAGCAARWLAGRVRPAVAPDWRFAASLSVPVAGIALLLPITLHMPVALIIGGSDGFRTWVSLSAWIAGPAHLVFAATSVLRTHQLVAGVRAWSPYRVYATTVITSCVPYVLLVGIPPALVAITGVLFLPLLEKLEGIVDRERDELAGLPGYLPRATVLPQRAAG